MNFKKNKNKLKFLLLSMILVGIPQKVDATRAEPFINPNQRTGFVDKDVPATIKLTAPVDGLPAGTVLYRHTHLKMDYYSPIVPSYMKGTKFDVSNGKYQDWGPWQMEGNKKATTMHVRGYYTSAVTSKTTTVYTNKSNSQLGTSVSIGTLPAGTNLKVLAYRHTSGRVFFDLTPFPTLASKSTTKVGSFLSSDKTVTLSGFTSILHAGWENNTYLHNFKKKAMYKDTSVAHLNGVEDGVYKNPSHAPSGLAGKTGEWRYIGYNAKGEALRNPYFVADDLGYGGCAPMYAYPWRLTPWNKNDSNLDPEEEDVTGAYNEFVVGRSGFPYDGGAYDSDKRKIVKKLHSMGALTPASPTDAQADVMVKRLSLGTHPTKQSALMTGQSKKNHHTRSVLVENAGLRDLYMYSINIIDEETGLSVVSNTGTINGPSSSKSGNVYKGKRYIARVNIANGANSYLLASSLKAQLGFTYNASINPNMNIGGVQNVQEMLIGNKGGLGPNVGSVSNNFDFIFTVGESQSGTMEVYAFVGDEHQGVDNLHYNNDLAFVKLYIKSPSNGDGSGSGGGGDIVPNCSIYNNGKNKVCGKGDIVPYAIQVKDENGVEVYRHLYGITIPEKKSGPIPGRKYYIEYTAHYVGDNIQEYVWVDPVNDNPNTTENEYAPGYWKSLGFKKYSIPLNYDIIKYSGGINQVDRLTKNAVKYMYDVNFKTQEVEFAYNPFLKFKTDLMMFEHPYVNTAFRVVPNDSRINFDTSNDRMEITVNDKYDIKMDRFYFNPTIAYVANGESKVNYSVGYDIELIVPDYVKKGDYQVLVDTAININGKNYYVKDYLTVGQNKNITHTLTDITVKTSTGGGSSFTGSANANYNKLVYETDFTNNSASNTMLGRNLVSPSTGSPTDTVKTPDSLNSNNINKGGDANNNCLYPRTRNTWTVTHRKTTWSTSSVSYPRISNGSTVTFNKHNTTYDNLSEADVTYEESFYIDKVLFRSKDTKDKKYGTDGWVNLLDSNEQKKATIKAGYGFELKIVTKYNTDAFTKRTWNVSTNSSGGTTVTNMNADINYGLQDIFLELPGTSSTRKILSSTGYGGSVIGLKMTSSINPNNGSGEWTYTIKPTNTLGVGSEPKIYIPSDMKDGKYTLKIYTPQVSGAGNVHKKMYSAMCDRKEVSFEIKGSAMNDLNSHETQ